MRSASVALFAALAIVLACSSRGARTPAEVKRIADGLGAAGFEVMRVARNANTGWSVLLPEGEVQWFKTSGNARQNPLRTLASLKGPHIVVLDLHDDVFVIVMAGKRRGSTLELGTGRSSAEELANLVRAAAAHRR